MHFQQNCIRKGIALICLVAIAAYLPRHATGESATYAIGQSFEQGGRRLLQAKVPSPAPGVGSINASNICTLPDGRPINAEVSGAASQIGAAAIGSLLSGLGSVGSLFGSPSSPPSTPSNSAAGGSATGGQGGSSGAQGGSGVGVGGSSSASSSLLNVFLPPSFSGLGRKLQQTDATSANYPACCPAVEVQAGDTVDSLVTQPQLREIFYAINADTAPDKALVAGQIVTVPCSRITTWTVRALQGLAPAPAPAASSA